MSRIRTVARTDKTHGVIHRDVTSAYEYSMFKKYGYNWKKKLRQLSESLRPKVGDAEPDATVEIQDQKDV